MGFWLSLVFVLISPCYALPISASDGLSGGNWACIGVLVLIVLLLTLLAILKQAYMKERYCSANDVTRLIKTESQASSRYSFAANEESRWSLPFISSTNIRVARDDSGFLVGIFGSPTLETRLNSSRSQDVLQMRQQSAFMYHLHIESRRHRSLGLRSGSRSTRKIGSRSISSNTENGILGGAHCPTGRLRCRSLQLPSRPDKAHASNSTSSPLRRLSLPNMHKKDHSQDILQRKGGSSIKSLNRDSLFDTPSINISLRLVTEATSPELPLPLSPGPHPLVSVPPALPSLKHNTHGKLRNRKYVPPIPPLPAAYTLAFNSPACVADAMSTKRSPGPLQISHPYALTLTPRIRVRNSKTARAPGRTEIRNSSQKEVLVSQSLETDASAGLSDLAICSGVDPSMSPPTTRQPFTSLNTLVNMSSLEIALPSSRFSPPLSAFPSLPVVPILAVRKPHKPARARRSPVIGPSPLRTMILPDPPSDKSICNLETLDKENKPEDTHSATFTGEEHPRQETRRSGGNRHPGDNDLDVGSSTLLSMIRELANETKGWDDSLFVDPNFKSMFRDSAISSNMSISSTSSKTPLPKDELGSLELDLYLVEGSQDNLKNVRIDDENEDLVSFWEEGGWLDRDQGEGVGLAW